MRHGAMSDEGRLLAAVSELDASPAPSTEVAAGRLVAIARALVPSDLSFLCLGEEGVFSDVYYQVEGQQLGADLPRWSPSARGPEQPVVALHDPTGLFISCRRSDVGSLRSLPRTIDYGHFWRPFAAENMVAAPVDFPNEHSYLASCRAASDFSDADIRLLDQLRPVGSRLLRRAAVSGLAAASASAWGLTPREAEVFAFAGVGLPLPSIASLLGLSVGTVRTQLGKAYTKTAVRSRAAATSALLDVVGSTDLQDAGGRLVPGEKGPLTRQESAVLRIAATGRTTSSIAAIAGISMETAKTHLANAYRKLGVQNRSQALLLVGTARMSIGGSEQTVAGTWPRRHQTPTRPAEASLPRVSAH